MPDSPLAIYDSMDNFTGGVNSGQSPDMIGPTQLSWGLNVSLHNGKVSQRPTFVQRFTLPTGKLQGAGYFSLTGGSLVCSIDGKIHKIFTEGTSFSSIEVTPTAGRNSRDIDDVDFCEAAGYLLISDGQSRAIIYDGASSRRATDDEIPVAKVLVYGNGRIWALSGSQVYAGDLYTGGKTHLKFTETEYLSEGGAFQLPEHGTAMAFLPRVDNTTATGDLIVFTQDTTTAIQSTIFDRTAWKSTQGMQKLLFDAIGCSSQRSIAAVNQDLYFRSNDGIRSIRNTYASLQEEGNTPISTEVNRSINSDTQKWQFAQSGISFDNRYLLSGNPRIFRHRSAIDDEMGYTISCKNIVSLDFAPVSSLGRSAPKIFEGEWTGLNVVQFVKGVFNGTERLFAFCADPDGNRIYEILRGGNFDVISGVRQRIQSSVETRRMTFQAPYAWKSLYSAQIWWFGVVGTVDYQVYYKDDNWPCWIEWGDSGTLCAKFEACEAPADCGVPPNYKAGYRPKQIFKTPLQLANNYLGNSHLRGTSFQVRVDFTGQAQIDKILIVCEPVAAADVGESDLLNYGGGSVGEHDGG